MLAYILYRAGSYFGRILPSKLSTSITWTIGQISCLVRVGTRRVIEQNLQVIHGGRLSKRELRRLSRGVVMNFARAIQIFLTMPNYRWETLRERVDMSEFETVVESLGSRPVFLLASIHMGPWELGGLCVSRMGFKLNTVALDHPSEQVTRFFDRRRRSIGIINHPMRKSYAILKEALERGECVALLVDRAYGSTHKQFEFFGVKTPFPLGHLFLAASTGVPIVTGVFVFDDGNRFKYVQGGVHYPPPDGTEDFDKLELLQAECLKDFERIVRDYGDQWFHFQPLDDPNGERHDE
jgi:KDO2-lipid IV(A) lauroyltransferase